MSVTGAVTTATTVTNTGSFSADALTATGLLANGAADDSTAPMTITNDLTSAGVTNYAAITVGGNMDAGAVALTNNAGGTIAVTGSLTIGADSTNAGTLTAGSFTGGAHAFGNTGTASLGVMTSTGAITSSGMLSISEGSTAASFVGSGGTTNLMITTTDLTTLNTSGGTQELLDLTGAATFDGSSKVMIYASEATLESGSAAAEDAEVIISGSAMQFDDGTTTDAYDDSTDSISVSSGSALLSITDVQLTAAGITADISINSAGDVLNGSGATDSTEDLANAFQSDDLAAEQVVTGVYGTLAANSGSVEELTDYLDDIRPDDSGSAVMAASEATTAAMGNIMNRGANLRGVSFGDLQTGDNVWIQALYSKADQDARDGNLGYESTLAGFTFGADRDMDGQTFGFAVSYGDSHIDFDGRDQRDEVTTYLGSLYHFMRRDTMYIDSSLTLGGSDHKGRRLSGAAQMNSKYHSEQ
ncbi:hypothetical protein CAPTEDRAFT_203459, partial [Capitella teleta]